MEDAPSQRIRIFNWSVPLHVFYSCHTWPALRYRLVPATGFPFSLYSEEILAAWVATVQKHDQLFGAVKMQAVQYFVPTA